MKKLLLAAIITCTINGIGQEDKTLRLGVQWGFHGNHTELTGGMTQANARFHHDNSGGGAFGIVGRYDFNNRWMLMSGLNFTSYGFEFAIAEDYSLLNKHRNFTRVKSETGSLEIPVMIFYKFNPNCKNVRWLIGAGFAESFIGAQTINKNVSQVADANTINYISSTTNVNGGGYYMLRWSVAREKMFKKGGILNASLLFNVGFNKIANATVNYTIDNQNYNHEFSTNGNFVGFRLAYYFKPFHNPWKAEKKN